MQIYDFLVHEYFQVLAFFPAPLAWFVSLAALILFIVVFIGLIRNNALFLILLVILLPVFIPVLARLFNDMYLFFVFLLHQVGSRF